MHNGEIVFVSDEILTKIPQKLNYESKKIRIWEENGINSKLKYGKAHNSILSGRYDYAYERPGDRCRVRETTG